MRGCHLTLRVSASLNFTRCFILLTLLLALLCGDSLYKVRVSGWKASQRNRLEIVIRKMRDPYKKQTSPGAGEEPDGISRFLSAPRIQDFILLQKRIIFKCMCFVSRKQIQLWEVG